MCTAHTFKMDKVKPKSVLLVLFLRLAFIFSVTGERFICSQPRKLEVSYGSTEIACGSKYNLQELGYLQHLPAILYKDADEDTLYSFLLVVKEWRPANMIDQGKDYVHWYMTNIKGSRLLNENEDNGGFTVLPYLVPIHQTETCNVYFLLLQQDHAVDYDALDLQWDPEVSKMFTEHNPRSVAVAYNMMYTERRRFSSNLPRYGTC